MSATSFTVTFPDELLEDAKEAAEMIGNDLNTFILQATFARVQELPAKLARPIIPTERPKERIARDKAWIRENYQTLFETYPKQWVYVYNQKVVGADRNGAKAQRQARVAIENFERDVPVSLFIGGGRYVF